jgi:hypothetical protein
LRNCRPALKEICAFCTPTDITESPRVAHVPSFTQVPQGQPLRGRGIFCGGKQRHRVLRKVRANPCLVGEAGRSKGNGGEGEFRRTKIMNIGPENPDQSGFTPVTGSPGRFVSSNAFSDGSVTAGGTVAAWAVVDSVNSRLLATGPLTGGGSVTSGEAFSLGVITIRLPGQ